MRQIRLTQGKFALVDDNDYDTLNTFAWNAWSSSSRNYETFYALRYTADKTVLRMHRVIMGVTDPLIQIDHKNCNGLDNTRANLRIATGSQNQHNQRKRRDNTSGAKGVTQRPGNKWEARIHLEGKAKQLGTFSTFEEATMAYNAAAVFYFGEFARINQPETCGAAMSLQSPPRALVTLQDLGLA